MKTRTALAATVALVAGLTPVAQQASAAGDHTLRAHEAITKAKFLGAAGHTFGEHLTFSSEVTRPDGSKLGVGLGDCVRMSGDSETNGLFHCTQSYRLTGGDLFAGGLYELGSRTTQWPVLGGTGRYRGAAGEMDFTSSDDDGKHFSDVFHLDH